MLRKGNTNIILDFGALGEQEVYVEYTIVPGYPENEYDQAELPEVELTGVYLWGQDILHSLSEAAQDEILDNIIYGDEDDY